MTDGREFSLEEANELVPTLHRLVSKQMLVQNELEDALRSIHEMTGSLPREIGPRTDDTPIVREQKEAAAQLLRQFEEGWAEVTSLGAVVKDPRTGLVDFLGRVGGEAVWLCWKFGEESITHYHALDEGFSGRKPLPSAVTRHRLLSLGGSLPGMPIDRDLAARAIEDFLRAMGRDPTDPDLDGTGARVAEAWERDILAGHDVDVGRLLAAESFPAPAGQDNGVVILRGALVTTMCPHHLLPAIGKATVAYVPGERIAGLGTLARVVDALSRRLTLQERIGDGVVVHLTNELGARGAACVLRMRHSCLAARGERRDAIVETLSTRGALSPTGTHASLLATLLGGEGD